MIVCIEFAQAYFLKNWIRGEKHPSLIILILNWNILKRSQKTVLNFLGKSALCLGAELYVLPELMKLEGSFGKTKFSSKALLTLLSTVS